MINWVIIGLGSLLGYLVIWDPLQMQITDPAGLMMARVVWVGGSGIAVLSFVEARLKPPARPDLHNIQHTQRLKRAQSHLQEARKEIRAIPSIPFKQQESTAGIHAALDALDRAIESELLQDEVRQADLVRQKIDGQLAQE